MLGSKMLCRKGKSSRRVASVIVASSLAIGMPAAASVKSVVLVHGASADGSGWKPLAEILKRDGFRVLVIQDPESSLADDVAATKRALAQAGPNVLVGHSYGGVIITEAGMDLQRSMYARSKSKLIELPGAHTAYISHAAQVAMVIEQAAAAAE